MAVGGCAYLCYVARICARSGSDRKYYCALSWTLEPFLNVIFCSLDVFGRWRQGVWWKTRAVPKRRTERVYYSFHQTDKPQGMTAGLPLKLHRAQGCIQLLPVVVAYVPCGVRCLLCHLRSVLGIMPYTVCATLVRFHIVGLQGDI